MVLELRTLAKLASLIYSQSLRRCTAPARLDRSSVPWAIWKLSVHKMPAKYGAALAIGPDNLRLTCVVLNILCQIFNSNLYLYPSSPNLCLSLPGDMLVSCDPMGIPSLLQILHLPSAQNLSPCCIVLVTAQHSFSMNLT